MRHLFGFSVAVVRVQHFAEVHRGLRVPLDRFLEVAFQAPHVCVLAGRTDTDSDDCVLRARRDHGTV